jgi:hypothetical protein
MQVAQATFAFLDVRLKHINRRTVFGQTGLMFFVLGLQKVLAVAVQQRLRYLLLVLMEEHLIARQKTGIQHGRTNCNILLGQGQAVR